MGEVTVHALPHLLANAALMEINASRAIGVEMLD
jgi:hypothetical protein